MFEIHQISLDPRPLGCKTYIKSRFPVALVERTRLPVQETRKMQVWSLRWEDPLDREMATHSSLLAWKIPWTKDPDRLQSMGSQRVGHDWAKEKKNFKTWKRIQMLFLLSYLFSRKPWKIHSSWHYLGVSQPSYSVPTNLGLRSLQCAACRGSLILLHIWLCPIGCSPSNQKSNSN